MRRAAVAVAVFLLLIGARARAQSTPEEWLEECDENKNGRVTCEEARKCKGAPIPVPKSHNLYEYMRDGDGDGQVCEEAYGSVIYGVGIASSLSDRVTAATPDNTGILRATEYEDGIRPVAVGAYLLGSGYKKVRLGVMAVVDAEVFSGSSLLKAEGIGAGLIVTFRPKSDNDWTQAFGLGLAYMRDSSVARLREDFALNRPSPAKEAVFMDTSGDKALFIVTYSFVKKRPVGAKNGR